MTQLANTVQHDQLIQSSRFKLWVQKIWIDNCEERLTYNENPTTMKHYWNTYKWWLRREYRHQQKAEYDRQERL